MRFSVYVTVVLTLVVLAVTGFAEAKATAERNKHDRDVIRFFLHHPRQAHTPAGERALWRIMGHVVTNLRDLQSARRLSSTNDWQTAVKTVQKVFPGSEWWLLSCSASEGGHGIWVWNGGAPWYSHSHGSGAGGWMQYMEGTFWGDFNAALADVRGRGYLVPSSASSYYSALGQALAGGWAYSHNRPSGKWTGSGC